MVEQPLLPEYEGACVVNLVPAVLEPRPEAPSWLPAPLVGADQVVVLVLDGLGWQQLQERRDLVPTLAGLTGGALTTVVPSTTSTALTSIATGLPPGEHGVVGYRVATDRGVLNVLRWAIAGRDARSDVSPEAFQPHEPFCGHRSAVVTRAEFRDTGFTRAHLAGGRFVGYRVTSTLVSEIGRLLTENEPFVYAYYDGLDKVSHEYGLGATYDAELRFLDQLVADILAVLPPGAALAVTADHGQVEVGDRVVELAPQVKAHLSAQSGEGRFRWLHARPASAEALLDAAVSHHAEDAWVVTREQVVAESWFGPKLSEAALARLGDVALVARTDVAFLDPDDTGPYDLVGRHGSVTPAEMLVPLLAHRA